MADEEPAGAAPIKRPRRKAASHKTATRKSATTKKSPAAQPAAELKPGTDAPADGPETPPDKSLINWAAVKRRYQRERHDEGRRHRRATTSLDPRRLREIARERALAPASRASRRRPKERRRPCPDRIARPRRRAR